MKENSNNEQSWHHWCRLCAKDDPQCNMPVFPKGAHSSTMATAIGRYFWVNIRPSSERPAYVCSECHTLLTSLCTFTERVNKVQAMFCMLQNCKSTDAIDLIDVRLQYGLLDENREHIIKIEKISTYGDDGDVHDGMKTNIADNDIQLHENAEQKELEDELEDEVCNVELAEEYEERTLDQELLMDDDCTEVNYQLETDCSDEILFKLVKAKDRQRGESHNETDNDKTYELDVAVRDKKNFQSIFVNNIVQKENLESTSESEDEKSGSTCSKEADNDEINSTHSVDKTVEVEIEYKSQEEPNTATASLKRKRGRPPNQLNLELRKMCTNLESDEIVYESTEAKYKCSFCNKEYKNLTSYRKHVIEAHNAAPDIAEYACSVCTKTFPSQRQLATHQRLHLPSNQKLIASCPHCDKKFTKLVGLKQHVLGFHRNEKPFTCDECGRGFKTLAALNEHKLVHTTECPCKCDVCGKGFKNKARLKVHAEIHASTSLVCTLCGMKLNTRRTLATHMLVHSDLKRYKCDFCDASFKRSKALKNHLILHTGLRPYKCPFCEKTFSNGSNCRSHKRKAHQKELMEEEAMGKKAAPIIIPKLEELRTRQFMNKVSMLNVKGNRGGLSLETRALLKKAEERIKNKNQNADGSSSSAVKMEESFNTTIDYCRDDNDEETIIYELIDEI